MGIKDKLKRTSRIFLSDSKEDVTGNGGNAVTAGGEIEEGTENATASAAADGVTDTPTDNADGTLASSGDQEEGAAARVSDSAQGAGDEAGADQSAENEAVKRRSSFKKLTSKAKKPVSGDAKRSELFQKFLKKFKRPVGVPAEKSADTPAANTATSVPEGNATKAEAKAENAAENANAAAQEASLDPASESATGAAATEPAK